MANAKKLWKILTLAAGVLAGLGAIAKFAATLYSSKPSAPPITVNVRQTVQLPATNTVQVGASTLDRDIVGQWRSKVVSCKYAIKIRIDGNLMVITGPRGINMKRYAISEQLDDKLVVNADGQRGVFWVSANRLHYKVKGTTEEFERCES